MSAIALEVVPLPVADVERALRFHVDRVGFGLGNTWVLQERGHRPD